MARWQRDPKRERFWRDVLRRHAAGRRGGPGVRGRALPAQSAPICASGVLELICPPKIMAGVGRNVLIPQVSGIPS
jgi:hypothetical protein